MPNSQRTKHDSAWPNVTTDVVGLSLALIFPSTVFGGCGLANSCVDSANWAEGVDLSQCSNWRSTILPPFTLTLAYHAYPLLQPRTWLVRSMHALYCLALMLRGHLLASWSVWRACGECVESFVERPWESYKASQPFSAPAPVSYSFIRSSPEARVGAGRHLHS